MKLATNGPDKVGVSPNSKVTLRFRFQHCLNPKSEEL